MNGDEPRFALPSARRLAVATLVSLGVAAVVLVGAVLPVEYGLDPLRIGSALGLMRVSPIAEAEPVIPAGDRTVPVPMGPLTYYGTPYKLDRAVFELGPYEYVEYKYRLEPGASMTYAWEATVQMIHDFHGDPEGGPEASEVSFDKQERSRGYGTHTAPFAGMHGWYWENPGGTRVTVTLTSAGFYSGAREYRSNRTSREHPLTPLDMKGPGK
jgi:hypothetical protein